jgi:hypothetical protein
MDNTETSRAPNTRFSFWKDPVRLWVNFSTHVMMAAILITRGIKTDDSTYFLAAFGFFLFMTFSTLQLLKHYRMADAILPALLNSSTNFRFACNLLALIGFCLVVGSILVR